eukprot:3187144-Pleurochrysis_carterae.AAC.1
MNGAGRLPRGTSTMHCPNGSKPCMEGQGMPSADLVAVHCYIPIVVKVASSGADQDAERKPQAALQGDAHEGRVNAAMRVSWDSVQESTSKRLSDGYESRGLPHTGRWQWPEPVWPANAHGARPWQGDAADCCYLQR